jgi:site-specific recombinase XerD
MKTIAIIENYVALEKSLGKRFFAEEQILYRFHNATGKTETLGLISKRQVCDFLSGGMETVTLTWFRRHTVLNCFFRYALSRGYITENPMPPDVPQKPDKFVPYIYSNEELRMIFKGAMTYQDDMKGKSRIDAYLIKNILMITYMLGLRISETLSIRLKDVDMTNNVVTICETKFFKSRIIPFNRQVWEIIQNFLEWRIRHNQCEDLQSLMFLHRGKPVHKHSVSRILDLILKQAGIKRDDAACRPRIHDLRHTFAVNRLICWYREKKDVQQMLPLLSTYMGHVQLSSTTVYLTMTADLLYEANIMFEKYVKGDNNE